MPAAAIHSGLIGGEALVATEPLQSASRRVSPPVASSDQHRQGGARAGPAERQNGGDLRLPYAADAPADCGAPLSHPRSPAAVASGDVSPIPLLQTPSSSSSAPGASTSDADLPWRTIRPFSITTARLVCARTLRQSRSTISVAMPLGQPREGHQHAVVGPYALAVDAGARAHHEVLAHRQVREDAAPHLSARSSRHSAGRLLRPSVQVPDAANLLLSAIASIADTPNRSRITPAGGARFWSKLDPVQKSCRNRSGRSRFIESPRNSSAVERGWSLDGARTAAKLPFDPQKGATDQVMRSSTHRTVREQVI